MKRLILKRISNNPHLTAGVLLSLDTGLPICFTLENPYLLNKRNVSCIPVGTYVCAPYNSERYKNCYVVTNVPDRDNIIFHIGNTEKDTKGCILPGLSFGELRSVPAVLNSGKAMDKIRGIIGENRFYLTVE